MNKKALKVLSTLPDLLQTTDKHTKKLDYIDSGGFDSLFPPNIKKIEQREGCMI